MYEEEFEDTKGVIRIRITNNNKGTVPLL